MAGPIDILYLTLWLGLCTHSTLKTPRLSAGFSAASVSTEGDLRRGPALNAAPGHHTCSRRPFTEPCPFPPARFFLPSRYLIPFFLSCFFFFFFFFFLVVVYTDSSLLQCSAYPPYLQAAESAELSSVSQLAVPTPSPPSARCRHCLLSD